MSKITKFINVFLFIVWVALLGILLYKDYAGGELEKEKIKELFAKKRYWYDIYVGDKRYGYAMTEFERAGDEIMIRYSRWMKVKKNEKNTVLTEELRTLTDLSYTIKSFQYFSHYNDENGVRVTGKVEGEDIICFLQASDKMKTHTISTGGKDFYLPITLIPVIHQKMLVPDSPVVVPMLDPVNLEINDRKVVLEEIRPIKVGINIFNLYRFRIGDLIIWSNEAGAIVKELYPSGITLYNSQFEGTMEGPPVKILFDYTNLPFLKSNTTLQFPEDLKALRVRISGFDLDQKLYKNSTVTLSGDILNIKKENIEELKKMDIKLPYNGKKMLDEYIMADEWIRSDYKPFQDTGLIYARSYKYDAFGFVNYLKGYLYTLIKTMPVFMLVDSEDLLKTLFGDYIERSIMFATYSRAAGLPTRIVGGLVYLKGYFYYHVWPEVWLDKWIPVDPTFMQFPADVTHIPLRDGSVDDVVFLVSGLDGIEVEVLSVEDGFSLE
jgi:hypothetical protein